MRKHQFITAIVIFVVGFVISSVIDVKQFAFPAKGTLSSPAVQNSWEYRVVSKYFQHGKKWEVDSDISQFVSQGFEIYSVTQSSADPGFYMAFVIRRPKQ